MKIWHQSFTVLEDLPAYAGAMEGHIRKIVHADTQVDMHGQLPGTYSSNYPGTDLRHAALFGIHGLQWVVQALQAQEQGYDAFAMCTIPNPMIREIRTLVDIPVVGYGEASCHLACQMGRRFGVLLFIESMGPLLLEQISQYGLAGRCAGVDGVGFTFQDVLPAFENPGSLIDRFRDAARGMIARGADVIVPGEMPLNVLLAVNGVSEVDGVPIIDGLAVTIKTAEMLADLRRTTGLAQTRHGFFGAAPPRERVREVLRFYGIDRLAG
ncbi:aspartate/glutamate racemase family protein [Bordetella sp. BOR01]|uniref:aspartate/glutamate racemase family protein n=1 Tax=Bordetella sp. BOR01 TaxID=2854779 RepID=UPI001C445775|nr:aspartate/glutamate racemase family protein [Bordetella sp. BOR01]MBV7482953.1 aspartate/glutamate racemase family protein [Bordetella sp. BOR01]